MFKLKRLASTYLTPPNILKDKQVHNPPFLNHYLLTPEDFKSHSEGYNPQLLNHYLLTPMFIVK